MINTQGTRILISFLICLSCFLPGLAQPTLDPDLKKPAKYENRTLRAEKTGQKKFNAPRRFFQNTYTHYNFFFNAREKLNRVLDNARAQQIDRYTELLSFYNYSLENTASQQTELDSVIYKVNAGIFLHDLRSDWMDNLYLLMGQAYYYRNTLDTAYMTFQYMNYAFSPKEEDGYDKVIGSNANEGGSVMKVSTIEKRNVIDKALSEPPSRNDALIWLVRTHITRNEMPQAATLIQTLRHDPTFPKRLHNSLDEVSAYWFYTASQYDSAAYYLEKALPVAYDKKELARWEYLLGQLYSRAGKTALAKDAFERCIKHTMNPVMEVAAQLQATQQITGINDVDWHAAIAALEKMARKERYTNYRDLIYYTIGQIEARRGMIPAAQAHLLKSVKYSTVNPDQKTRSYQLLGDLSFYQKEYVPAKNYYDSVEMGYLPEAEAQALTARLEGLEVIASNYYVINRQDSLQRLAAMPEDKRNDILTRYLRQLRKQRGLKDDDLSGAQQAGGPVFVPAGNTVPSDLFVTYNSGEWYFYNNSLKSRGFTEFRNKWGNRPNTDNWRRSNSVSNVTFNKEIKTEEAEAAAEDAALSLEALIAKLPITPEQQKVSNDSILQSQYMLANTIQNSFEDYATAAVNYEGLLDRFPASSKEAEILYQLSICYQMLGKTADLDRVKQKLAKEHPETREAKLAADPVKAQEEENAHVKGATVSYSHVYDLFIEGNFDGAIAAKAIADSIYGSNFWTPQLLYIEAIYHIKKRDDNQAINVLQLLIGQFPDHPIAEKAKNLISVVQRRAEIEDYLTKLEIQRPAEDSIVTLEEKAVAAPVEKKPETVTPDPREAKAVQPKTELPAVKPVPGITDSSRLKKEAPAVPTGTAFSRHAAQPHFVVIVLENVDPVYVNETRNAFNRYNKENYYTVPMNVTIVGLTDQVKMVAIKGLANEQAARDYIVKAKAQASKDIIPWLKADKYYFIPVAESNMDLLMNNKDLPAYRNFLKQLFPSEF
jgi:tetratricopeptide (TPR) repeat protein